ncbi:MAG: helix-turn-helix domain-containing protein [Candidatus Aminicenantes bacterium]|nr:helix-turn-helix domain-containing protein [Candidatus Aminicenantes bacterium]
MDEKNLKTAIGKRFAEVRKTKGLSQVAFSKQLGVSSATVANIERGFIYPNMNLLYYLIFKEDVNPYWLFSGSGVVFALPKDFGPGINLDKHFADPEVKELIDLLNVPKVKRSLLSYVDQLREIFAADIAEYLKSKPGAIESSRQAAVNE